MSLYESVSLFLSASQLGIHGKTKRFKWICMLVCKINTIQNMCMFVHFHVNVCDVKMTKLLRTKSPQTTIPSKGLIEIRSLVLSESRSIDWKSTSISWVAMVLAFLRKADWLISAQRSSCREKAENVIEHQNRGDTSDMFLFALGQDTLPLLILSWIKWSELAAHTHSVNWDWSSGTLSSS